VWRREIYDSKLLSSIVTFASKLSAYTSLYLSFTDTHFISFSLTCLSLGLKLNGVMRQHICIHSHVNVMMMKSYFFCQSLSPPHTLAVICYRVHEKCFHLISIESDSWKLLVHDVTFAFLAYAMASYKFFKSHILLSDESKTFLCQKRNWRLRLAVLRFLKNHKHQLPAKKKKMWEIFV
jgi:hypothetical protein